MPFLSVVIANYNYGRFLGDAIRSVITQSCDDYELLIIDGGSTDESLDVIHQYADRISYWTSERDKGQSNAFNKGFARANGRFLTWLNADDVMLPGVIEQLKRFSAQHESTEWFVGGCFWLDENMRIVNAGRGRRFSEIRYRCGDVNGCGPSTFFTKRLLNSVGGVDERFNLLMDSDLWVKFARSGARYLPFCAYAWGLRLHPAAKMSGHNFADERVRKDHLAKVERERQMMLSGFGYKKMTTFRYLLSVSWLQVLLARIDLVKFRGRHYKEYFR